MFKINTYIYIDFISKVRIGLKKVQKINNNFKII